MQTPSSQNALKNGLFAAHDFIRPDEQTEYAETRASLQRELSPAGILETSLVEEILSATWRLRRCRLVESTHGLTDEASVAETQKSIDRARSHAHNVLRRSLAELRKLQTERCTRIELNAQNLPGVTESRKVLAAAAAGAEYTLPKPKADDDFSALDAYLFGTQNPFCKTAEPAPEPDSQSPPILDQAA
jgi:hypothetical protein